MAKAESKSDHTLPDAPRAKRMTRSMLGGYTLQVGNITYFKLADYIEDTEPEKTPQGKLILLRACVEKTYGVNPRTMQKDTSIVENRPGVYVCTEEDSQRIWKASMNWKSWAFLRSAIDALPEDAMPHYFHFSPGIAGTDIAMGNVYSVYGFSFSLKSHNVKESELLPLVPAIDEDMARAEELSAS